MARRARPKRTVAVRRGFPPFDPRGLRLFGDRGAPLLSRSLMEVLDEHGRLLKHVTAPVRRDGADLPRITLGELFWTGVGGKPLKAIDPHATVDRAFEVLQMDQDGILGRPFAVPEQVAASDLRLAALPKSPRLRKALETLVGKGDMVVADTIGISMRDLREAGEGWAEAVEWGVLLEHFCIDPESFGLFDDVRSALSLDLVSEMAAEELLRADGSRIPSTWVDVLRRRKGWGLPTATLDAIGTEMGVTRERIRQLENRLLDYSYLHEWPMPPVIEEALEITLDTDVPADSVGLALHDSGITVTADWGRESVAGLLSALGRIGDAEAIREAALAAERRATQDRLQDREQVRRVRSARSHMGFVNLAMVDDGAGIPIPPRRVVETVEGHYSRVANHQGWVLAGKDIPTAAENAALAQLGVADPLPVRVLVEGLDRIARKRNDVALPPADVVVSLLEGIGCIAVEDGRASASVPAELPEPGSNDRWLYDLLVTQPDESMHVDEVLRVARADGRNEASISVHLTYSPIVRRVGGVVSLVGADLDPADRARIKRVANAKRVDSDYSVEWTDRGPVVTLTLGTGYLTSSVVGMRRNFLDAVDIIGLGTSCCGQYRSDARLGISGGNAVYGWTTLFHHWVSAHDVSEGDRVRILLGESVVSTLEPWARADVESTGERRLPEAGAEDVEPDLRDDAPEPGLWALPDQPVQLGLPASIDQPSRVLGSRWPEGGRRPAATGPGPYRGGGATGAHEVGLWEVPVQGALGAGDQTAEQDSEDISTGRPARGTSDEAAGGAPEPGSVSVRPKGERRLTLSAARREIVVARDGSALSDQYGRQAGELAEAWLRIRPTGGRVWVDDDGFATTLSGGQLVYLGRIPDGWAVQ